jgi:translation initiation factor 1A
MGASRMNVICGDGKSRMARIPGRMKRRARVRAGDLLIIKPWDIQNEKSDVVYRYTRTQSRILSKRHLIPEEIDVF